MVDSRLLDYVKKELKKGFSEDLIKEALKVRGYIQKDIDEVFDFVRKFGEKIDEIPEDIEKGVKEAPTFFEHQIEKIPAEMEKAAEVIKFDKHKIKFRREWIYVVISVLLVGLGYYYIHEMQVALKGFDLIKLALEVLYKVLLLGVFVTINTLFVKFAFKIVKEGAPMSKVWDIGFVLGLFLLVFSFVPYVKWMSFALFNFLLVALLKKHFDHSNMEMIKIWGFWLLFWIILAAIMATFLYLI